MGTKFNDQKDEQELKALGYKQELLRDIGGFSNFALSFSIISILTGAVTLYGHGLNYGGPLVMFLGWALVSILVLPVAVSLAELASAFPTAGALYHWASFLGNKHWGWFTAMFNLLGQFAITAGIDYGLTEFLIPLLGLEGRPDLSGIKLGIYGVILFSHGLLNHLGITIVGILNTFSAWYHMAGVAILIGCLVFWAPHQPVHFLLSTQNNGTQPYWYAFAVGLLQAAWTFTGYDASAHISEETHNPKVVAPWGIFLAVLVSGIFGWVLLIVVTLSIQDLQATMGQSNPFLYILSGSLGENLGRVLTWMCALAMWFCGLGSVTSNSRMIFAFARDEGLPMWSYWAHVSPRWKTPAYAIWISVFAAFGLAVFSNIYSVIVSVSTIALYVSYGIPIFIGLRAKQKGIWKQPGPWNAGKFSNFLNYVSLFWIAVMSVLFVIPPNQLAGQALLVMTLLFSALYILWVKNRFKGPPKVNFLPTKF